MKAVMVVWLLVMCVACTSEYQMQIPVGEDGKLAESEEFKTRAATLPLVDREALAAYLIRASMAAAMTSMPMQPVTVSEAISAQRKFEAEQKAKADAEAVEQAKLAAEAKAIRDAEEERARRVRDMVSGSLLEKTFRPADYTRGVVQDAIMFSVLFKNKTDKDITGMKGSMVFNNTLGDNISSIGISVEYNIPAGGEFTWSGGLKYNQFMEDHMALRNADISKIVSTWQPEMIMFADGTVERLK